MSEAHHGLRDYALRRLGAAFLAAFLVGVFFAAFLAGAFLADFLAVFFVAFLALGASGMVALTRLALPESAAATLARSASIRSTTLVGSAAAGALVSSRP